MEDLEVIALVHNVVATTNQYIEAIDKILSHEAEAYVIPSGALVGLKAALSVNSEMVSKMLENQLDTADQLDKFTKKVEQLIKEGKK